MFVKVLYALLSSYVGFDNPYLTEIFCLGQHINYACKQSVGPDVYNPDLSTYPAS